MHSAASTLSAKTLPGKTVRLSWASGPTKGTTHEHVFHKDGTVEWHLVPSKPAEPAASAGTKKPERPKYFASDVAGGVLISYLSQSGYTLTVALDPDAARVVGVASNDKTWTPVSGSFELDS